jgi:bacterioferritin (cytochrome b1)
LIATIAMYDPKVIADELSDVLATETQGLLRHIIGSAPHVTPKTYDTFTLLKKIAANSAHHARRVSRLFDALELSPRPRSFDPRVANYHFLSVASVLPAIVDEKQRQIAAYERAIDHIGDNPRYRVELQALLEENREHLQQLQALLNPEPPRP